MSRLIHPDRTKGETLPEALTRRIQEAVLSDGYPDFQELTGSAWKHRDRGHWLTTDDSNSGFNGVKMTYLTGRKNNWTLEVKREQPNSEDKD